MTQKVTFTPTTWVQGGAPGISATQKNRIETGIDDLATAWNAREHDAIWSYPAGDIAVEAGEHRLYAREDRTIEHVQAWCDDPPTGSDA